MNKKEEKEFYQLWWEYLMRSSAFQDFCDWFVKRQEDPLLPVPEKFSGGIGVYTSKYERHIDTLYNIRGAFHPIVKRYVFDLKIVGAHTSGRTFEQWWNEHKEPSLKHNKEYHFKQSVEPAHNYLKEEIEGCIKTFKFYNDREPSLDEFKSSFLLWMMRAPGAPLLLLVRPRYKLATLVKRFKKIVKKHRPTTRSKINFSNLRDYLHVYKRWETKKQTGITWRDIMADKEIENRPANSESFYMYKRKAERIIKNVEKGVFPGNYQ